MNLSEFVFKFFKENQYCTFSRDSWYSSYINEEIYSALYTFSLYQLTFS